MLLLKFYFLNKEHLSMILSNQREPILPGKQQPWEKTMLMGKLSWKKGLLIRMYGCICYLFLEKFLI